MSATTKISFEQFQKIQEDADETIRYELDEGELIVTSSPTLWHNIVASRIFRILEDFAIAHDLGLVAIEADFRLPAGVRKPDVAFIAKDRLSQIDIHHTPIALAPTLAIEVISPSNSALYMRKKLSQYMAAGIQSVWLVYPDLRLIEIHNGEGMREFTAPDFLKEDRLFPGARFSLSLASLFDQNLGQSFGPGSGSLPQ